MMNDESPSSLPPSGPWSGYYLYGQADSKHRMHLGLIFSADGKIWGDGIDDIAPFMINGTFDVATNQARWTKSYIGKHSVEYHGFYDQRSICGNWTIAWSTGGFWIWPSGMEETEGVEAEIEQPIAAVAR
jgi:hypothetical protein